MGENLTKRLERKKQDRFLEDIERLTLTNDRVIFNQKTFISQKRDSNLKPV